MKVPAQEFSGKYIRYTKETKCTDAFVVVIFFHAKFIALCVLIFRRSENERDIHRIALYCAYGNRLSRKFAEEKSTYPRQTCSHYKLDWIIALLCTKHERRTAI